MKIVTIALALTLTGCAVIKIPVVTDGSRADGVVTMSYQYGGFEDPQVDWDKANQQAASSCKAWGYSSAKAFGGTTTSCATYSYQYGCTRNQVNIRYQCIN